MMVSEHAEKMLRAMASDGEQGGHGVAILTPVMAGLVVKAGGLELAEAVKGRERAAWEAGAEELLRLGLIKQVNESGDVFVITTTGYEWVDANS